MQLAEPWYVGGANTPNLVEAQQQFLKTGAMEERFTRDVRKPTARDRTDPSWRLIEPGDKAHALRLTRTKKMQTKATCGSRIITGSAVRSNTWVTLIRSSSAKPAAACLLFATSSSAEGYLLNDTAPESVPGRQSSPSGLFGFSPLFVILLTQSNNDPPRQSCVMSLVQLDLALPLVAEHAQLFDRSKAKAWRLVLHK